MKIKSSFMLFCLCLCLPMGAQTLHWIGNLAGDAYKEITLYVNPMENQSGNGVPLSISASRFEGDVPVASDGFYKLYGVNNGGQIAVPLYCPHADKTVELELSMVDGCLQIEKDANNKALSAFNNLYYKRGRELWMNGKSMSSEQIIAFLKDYSRKADSLATYYQCAEPVRKYLSLWAYTIIAESYNSLSYMYKAENKSLPFAITELQEEPSKVLDTPLALYFQPASTIIIYALPQGELKERLAYLMAHYACEQVRNRVADVLISEYIRKFNYAKDYEAGLSELVSLIDTYGLNKRYVADFKVRKASIRGNEFPEVLLTDVEGKEVKISQYKGYYLYIDMWASWCGPCCREVPYLQELEKNLKNEKVKFVSISIDKGTKEWKAKMQALNMHGNQLINQDNKLAEVLNVSGIPHFLIYDKEGKLYQYKAPRPSSGEELKQLLESLR